MKRTIEGWSARARARKLGGCLGIAALVLQPAGGWAEELRGAGTIDALFAVQDFPERVCRGDGAGNFACSDLSPDMFRTNDVALGFVDGDDKLDAVFALSSAPDRVCLGNASGGFSCSNVSGDSTSTSEVALGLVDGDEHLDAVFAIGAFPDGMSRVCLGDGLGGFSCADTVPGDFIGGVTLGFIDGDSNLDLILASSNPDASTPTRVCLGDGAGGFSCSDLTGEVSSTYEAALGFVDGDADIDVVFANNFPRPRVCLGDGLGGFPTCSDVDNLDNFYRGVALGFVDGDANVDAVFARAVDNPNRVCLGDGAGGFSCADVSSDANSSYEVALGFVDGDGNLDAVFANYLLQPDRVCFGDGAGGFSSCADANDAFGAPLGDPQGPDNSVAVALGEIVDLEIFEDGFESGDTSAWSETIP